MGELLKRAYTVFVDESFDGFLGLSDPKGYFCYGALMVPTDRLADLARFWASRRERLVRDYRVATGFALKDEEFKSGFFNKLTLASRRNYAERLAKFLRADECFIGGFYTTVDTYALYNLRTDVAKDDEAKFLPEDWSGKLAGTKEKLLLNNERMPGVAYLLLGLLHATLEITLNWLGSQGFSFEVVYDPREKKEDAFMLKHVGGWLNDEMAAFKRFPGAFRGATATVRSNDSAGLMLCDLIVRDIRMLFADLRGLTEEGSSKELIVPFPQKDQHYVIEIAGQPVKGGHLRPMSEKLVKNLSRPTANSTMPLYLDRLARMILSCNASCGEMRSIDFRALRFEDMVD